MIHLGDITKIHGCAVPITDVVIGGSPCQDLSVAGKREGLKSKAKGDEKTTRSGLFIEQVRIVKEMRYADQCGGRTDQLIRPRYMVWENVPGAFSSNGGEDFRAVLEEICRVADETSNVPGPKTGKWDTSGAILGKGWSVAWRVFDAQFWGVPQRRRRIALVADFGGHTAPEILFERNGLCWDSAESGEARKGTTGDSAGCTCETEPVTYPGVGVTSKQNASNPQPGDPCHTLNQDSRNYVCSLRVSYGFKLGNSEQARSIGFQEERSPTLNAECGGNKPAICYGIGGFNSKGMLSENPKAGIYEADTSRTLDLNGGNPACNQSGICVAQCYDMTHAADVIRERGETAPTLQSRMGTGGNQVPLTFGIGNGQSNQEFIPERTGALNCMHDQKAIATFQNTGRGWWNQSDVAESIRTPCGGDSTKANLASDGYAVRRLTPLECERLQGYPDGWTDIGAWTDSKGKLHKESSDSARYKALGNSIALPPWKWVLKRLCAVYERDATLASLFDGIGGFPLIWEQLNGKGSCLWASEIEEFPIAVTKRRFSKVALAVGAINETL